MSKTNSLEIYSVSGLTNSRLVELEKYGFNTELSKKYKISNSFYYDGVNLNESITGGTENVIVYYIGGITYKDFYQFDNYIRTEFFFVNYKNNPLNFDSKNTVIDNNIFGIVEKPKIESDVFIIRNEQSVLENNYRLRNIRNIGELRFYGDSYFNIVNNV